MRIAFAGLGNMGEPMARLLLNAGYSLIVYIGRKTRASGLERQGATIAATPAAAAASAELSISMLADDRAVREVTLGENGIAGLRPGSVHISSSTIGVELARELAAEHQRRGQRFMTAALLGRPGAV